MQLGRKNKSYVDKIQEIVDSLDKYWFVQKKKQFEKLSGGEDSYEIDTTPDGWEEYYNGLDDEEKAQDNTRLSESIYFETYCTNYYWTSSSDCTDSLVTSIIEIVAEIISKAKPDLAGLNGILQNAGTIVHEQIAILKIDYGDPIYIHILNCFLKKFDTSLHNKFHEQIEALKFINPATVTSANKDIDTVNSKSIQKIIPVIDKGALLEFYNILMDYFKKDDHEELLRILKTGDQVNNHLLFMGNGNKLADCYKQLFAANLIAGCNKKQLRKWIMNNFNYINGDEICSYKDSTLEDILSSKDDKCKSPIIDVKKNNKTGEYSIAKH
jgi:hypothetical protein